MPKRKNETAKKDEPQQNGSASAPDEIPTRKRGKIRSAVTASRSAPDPVPSPAPVVPTPPPPKSAPKKPRLSTQPVIENSAPGEVLVFGSNDASQLGLEDPSLTKRYPFPIPAEKFGGQLCTKIAAGEMHSVVLTTSGQVYTWGCNDEGALGTGKSDGEDDWMPKQVSGIKEKIIDVSAGDSHTAFLTQEGQIYMVGTMRDPNGAFGLKQTSAEPTTTPFLLLDMKSRADGIIRDVAAKIASGTNHFAYLNKHGEVHLLGDMSSGQLGPIPTYRSDGGRTGKAYFLQRRKVFIKNGRRFLSFSDVWCTSYGTFVRDTSNCYWACGNNTNNQLGFPQETDGGSVQSLWKEVVGLRDKEIRKIVGTPTYTAALAEDGTLFVFGYKEYLGFSADIDRTFTEIPVRHPADLAFGDVGCSSNNAIVAVTKAGDLYAWGSPSSSVLGTDPDDDAAVPVPRQIHSKNTEAYKIIHVAVGALHAMLIGVKKEE